MGLFGISTVPMVDDVFAEQDKEGKNSNIKGNPDATTTPISNPCTELPEKDKPKTDKHKK